MSRTPIIFNINQFINKKNRKINFFKLKNKSLFKKHLIVNFSLINTKLFTDFKLKKTTLFLTDDIEFHDKPSTSEIKEIILSIPEIREIIFVDQ